MPPCAISPEAKRQEDEDEARWEERLRKGATAKPEPEKPK